MKKLILYSLLCMAAFLPFTSCDRLLEEETFGKPTSDELLSKDENMIMLVGQIYADVKWLHDHWGYWGLNTLTSDEAVCPVRMPGSDWSDNGYWAAMNNHTWTANDKSFENVWNKSSQGAVTCNKILATVHSKKDILSEADYNRYCAELITMRSYYYYTLFDCFGRIPYSDDYADSEVPQSEPYEVWSHLIKDLEANAEALPLANVPDKAANYGRATQGLAYALLARLYLNAESYGVTPQNCGLEGIKTQADFYTRCIEACDKIIDSKVYQIEPDFFTNFKVYNEPSEENIFVIVENGNASFDYQDVAGSMANKLRISLLTLNYCHMQAWNLIEKPWNGFAARPAFLDRYEYGVDRRGPCDSTLGTRIDFHNDAWGWFLGPVYHPTVTDSILVMTDKEDMPAIITKNIRSLTEATPCDGARLTKYEVEEGSSNKFNENDFVLFRYADVLWMKAESILRGGEGSIDAVLADPEFQLMRTRVGLLPYGTLSLDEVLDERGREFAWENIRRRDLIRFGRFNDPSYVEYLECNVGDNYLNWFPIPRLALETAGGRWSQNEGYSTDM